MSERAVVRVHPASRNVVMRMSGESPLRYFAQAPRIRVSVGDRVLSEIAPSADFTAEVPIPADALAAANGRIVLTSDRSFVAGEKEGTADRRKLADTGVCAYGGGEIVDSRQSSVVSHSRRSESTVVSRSRQSQSVVGAARPTVDSV